MNKDKIKLDKLKEKAKNLIMKYPGYDIEYEKLSLDDIENLL